MSVSKLVRTHLMLTFEGLVAVHAARAVHAALAGVEGIATASVSLAGAEVEFEGDYDPVLFAAHVARAVEPIGIRLLRVTIVQQRMLPVL
ncbi:MAG: hypothetical protein IT353_15765 [Gemmatimonadaceae bacterium]|nr:hypothetical protein [Gemmatimonadaceae bacterium]